MLPTVDRSEYIHSTYQCHTITDTKPHSGTVRTALVTLSHSAERARPERKSEETRVVMSAVACRLSSRTTGDQRGGRTCVTPLRHATQSTQQHRSPKARVKNVHDAEGQVTAQVWGRPLSGGRVAVVFFNRGEATRNVSATFEEMGIACGMETATVTVTDVWSGDVVSGVSSPVVVPAVEAHGVAFLVLAPE